ncbi:hypothetical protein RFI_15943 [Reticulomyxa filosa]|uniref:Uncharacterized protein n=1 Tax=Reticulomyxa filosa TaxID=46433 RepID=X6N5G6_RETFI|nr:hypothetical protein RFI_15943 [Reticulomyxa filosa]|eukprot:ETO21261.1 hypothetical protein RFI_15943 [Reticulomyxa filosa]
MAMDEMKNKLKTMPIFRKRLNSPTDIHLKKEDNEEPPWDTIVELTDLCNNDLNLSKKIISYLRKITQRSIEKSLDNPCLKNCLIVIDSLVRNGNDNLISCVHQQYLRVLYKYLLLTKEALVDDKDKSLLWAGKRKTCQDIALELILLWAFGMDQIKYPQFKQIYFKLSVQCEYHKWGYPLFSKKKTTFFFCVYVDKSQLVPIGESHGISIYKNKDKQNNTDNTSTTTTNKPPEPQKQEEEKERDNSSPWTARGLQFGVWYKKKLKEDLKVLADMICMAQDVIAMQVCVFYVIPKKKLEDFFLKKKFLPPPLFPALSKKKKKRNVEDIEQIHAELRETLNRIVCIALRAENPGACQTLMQWIVIISGLIDCCNKLKKGERVTVPGVTRHHLQILIDCL